MAPLDTNAADHILLPLLRFLPQRVPHSHPPGLFHPYRRRTALLLHPLHQPYSVEAPVR